MYHTTRSYYTNGILSHRKVLYNNNTNGYMFIFYARNVYILLQKASKEICERHLVSFDIFRMLFKFVSFENL